MPTHLKRQQDLQAAAAATARPPGVYKAGTQPSRALKERRWGGAPLTQSQPGSKASSGSGGRDAASAVSAAEAAVLAKRQAKHQAAKGYRQQQGRDAGEPEPVLGGRHARPNRTAGASGGAQQQRQQAGKSSSSGEDASKQ